MEHNRRYFDECWLLGLVTIWFSLYGQKTLTQSIFSYVPHKKEGHAGLEQHEGDYIMNI